MEWLEYYLTTFKNSFQKIGTFFAFLILGYLLFFKLPFLIFLRNVKKAKQSHQVKDEVKTNQKSLGKNKSQFQVMTIEKAKEIFELKDDQFTQEDLKKRYRELLKMNHPDKVASLSLEFQKLAHKKTKEINDAYDFLISKLS